MPILESVLAALQQEGYRPVRENGDGAAEQTVTFRYYGQPARVRVRPLGAAAIAGLECTLPRPAPSAADAETFGRQHPLARLSDQEGRALLHIESVVTGADTGGQFMALLHLLDSYAADVVFGPAFGDHTPDPAPETAPNPVPDTAPDPAPDTAPAGPLAEPPPRPADAPPVAEAAPVDTSPSAPGAAPTPPVTDTQRATQDAPLADPVMSGWDAILDILNERFHPLARAMAALRLPAPDEVHMDMLQGRQVRGTAIMMWGSPPDAVVVCEPGQILPRGYQGNTWLRHQTTDQVALDTQAFLRAVGRA